MAYYGTVASQDFSTHVKNESNEVMLDEHLLAKLLSIHAPSKEEEPMIKFMFKYISENIPNCKIDMDNSKNILITKGSAALYPCFVAHLDEVTSNTKESNRTIKKLNNVFIGINNNTGKYAGCPGD